MVQKSPPRVRGRPRAYDPDQALAAAMQAFWRLGYCGTSLEELSDATDMNRPSMYAAFGDKRTLYLKTVDAYIETALRLTAQACDAPYAVPDTLREFFAVALAWYHPEGEPPRGCYLIATAATESMLDEEVQRRLQVGLGRFEALFEQRFRAAQAAGELPASADPAALASMVMAVNHTLAFRSRAGVPRAELVRIIENAIQVICGARPTHAASSPQPVAGTDPAE